MTGMERDHVLNLARKILSEERIAVQNAEAGHEKAIEHHQKAADEKMAELADYCNGRIHESN